MATSIDIECFDGEYTFRLTMDQITALEDACSAGIGEIYARTLAGRYTDGKTSFVNPLEGRYRYDELIQIIRQGLIGGNSGLVDGRQIAVNSTKANTLIKTYVHADRDNPVERAWELAAAVLHACVHGYEPAIEEAQKKSETEEAPESGSTEGKSSETAS